MERDRLAEYVRVLNKRLAEAEEKASEAEFYLRDERRKTAKLERMLEQGGRKRDSDPLKHDQNETLAWTQVFLRVFMRADLGNIFHKLIHVCQFVFIFNTVFN